MGYADHEGPRADSTGMFGALHHESADGVQYADSGVLPAAPHPGEAPRLGETPRRDTGSRLDADTGTYPVLDRYAGYERSGDDRAIVHHEVAGDRPFNRVYARPADPGRTRPPGEVYGGTRDRGWRPAAGYPNEVAPPAEAMSGEVTPTHVTLTRRLAGLRPDRWVIAAGSLAAAVAVVVAFATAGGSPATSGGASVTRPATTHTAAARVTQPACVSPAPGR